MTATDTPVRGAVSLRCVPVCLALAISLSIALLAMTAPAEAISGYAVNGPAVAAQYPDQAPASAGTTQRPPITNLRDITRVTKRVAGRPAVARRMHTIERQVREASVTLFNSPLVDKKQKSSIAILALAAGVMLTGGLLRWRRGLSGV